MCHPRNYDHRFRVVLVGDTLTGKSEFIRLTVPDQSPVGMNFVTKTMILDDTRLILQIWDTSGIPRFLCFLPSYLREADGVMLMYNICIRSSLESIENKYISILQENCPQARVILLGNKCSPTPERKVSFKEAGDLARRLNIKHHFETDLLTGTNMEEAVVTLASECLHKVQSDHSDEDIEAEQVPEPAQKSTCTVL